MVERITTVGELRRFLAQPFHDDAPIILGNVHDAPWEPGREPESIIEVVAAKAGYVGEPAGELILNVFRRRG